eukprot:102139-Pelagomonas_calceolata.AAC.1
MEQLTCFTCIRHAVHMLRASRVGLLGCRCWAHKEQETGQASRDMVHNPYSLLAAFWLSSTRRKRLAQTKLGLRVHREDPNKLREKERLCAPGPAV